MIGGSGRGCGSGEGGTRPPDSQPKDKPSSNPAIRTTIPFFACLFGIVLPP